MLTGNPDLRRRGRLEVGQGEGRRRGDRGRLPVRSPAAARPTPRGSGSTRPASRSARTARSRSTSTSGPRTTKVYAIGDLVRGPALAHKAQEEGVVAVETIAGEPTHPVDPDLVPGATFCHPQVASVGMTEAAGQGGRQGRQGRALQARRRSAPGRSTTTATGSSRSSPTPSTARSSAPTSSATAPAT